VITFIGVFMRNKVTYSILMASLFIYSFGLYAEEINGREREQADLKKTVAAAKARINSADTYQWKDTLRFLPEISVSRRSPYNDATSEETETYVSASISLSQFYDVADIEEQREIIKRKAARRVESLGYSIEKLIERKYLVIDQLGKLKQMIKSIEDPLEAANWQNRADQLQLQLNEILIEIEQLYAEIEYTCVEVER